MLLGEWWINLVDTIADEAAVVKWYRLIFLGSPYLYRVDLFYLSHLVELYDLGIFFRASLTYRD